MQIPEMDPFSVEITATWDDIDMNGHARNTAYSEYAIHGRIAFFAERGLTPDAFRTLGLGPVLLREELLYKREIFMLEKVRVTCEMKRASKDFRKFTFRQEILKENGKVAAQVTVDWVWIDLESRKVVAPPQDVQEKCAAFPRSEDFEWWN
ncbi:MAG: acyl-CoA thioesterase [Saprospiraceae bacterium]|jgi:acyl-CoA thioester hydrolase